MEKYVLIFLVVGSSLRGFGQTYRQTFRPIDCDSAMQAQRDSTIKYKMLLVLNRREQAYKDTIQLQKFQRVLDKSKEPMKKLIWTVGGILTGIGLVWKR